MTYGHDVEEYPSHIMTMSFMRIVGMRMVVQIWALLGMVELIVVIILTKSIARRYRRWERILLRIPANSIYYRVVWVVIVCHAFLFFWGWNV